MAAAYGHKITQTVTHAPRPLMGKAIEGSLPMAVGIALSPVPIIAVVLMLTSRKARVNGPAFVAGTLGVGVPTVLYFALGKRSEELLARLKRWISKACCGAAR
jgi:hypothetical protein